MKLLSVNVSLPKQVLHNGKIITTGIYKEPVSDRVMVHALNIQGDGQADRKVHGGRDMAVYAYPFKHYKFWEETLGRPGVSVRSIRREPDGGGAFRRNCSDRRCVPGGERAAAGHPTPDPLL